MPQQPTCAPGLLATGSDKGAGRNVSHHIPLILLLLPLLPLLPLLLCSRLLRWERLWRLLWLMLLRRLLMLG
jgi:hypothetical protein